MSLDWTNEELGGEEGRVVNERGRRELMCRYPSVRLLIQGHRHELKSGDLNFERVPSVGDVN